MRLPTLAYFWIAIEVTAVVAGGYAMQRPVDSYERVDAILSAVGVDLNRYERLAEDESEALVLIGSLLIGIGIIAAVAHQGAAAKRALTATGGEVAWLERIRERAGPELQLILESQGAERSERAAKLKRLLLVVGSRSWGGKGNKAEARLAYYRASVALGAGKTLTLEGQYPDGANFPERFTHPHPPFRLVAGRRRFGRFWSDQLRAVPSLRAGALLVPVGSPLEFEGVPFGLVVIDVPRKRLLRQGSDTVASLLSAWLGATDLAARRATR